jgi:hypothetical protein
VFAVLGNIEGLKRCFKYEVPFFYDAQGKCPLDYAIDYKNFSARDLILSQLNDHEYIPKNVLQKSSLLMLVQSQSLRLPELLQGALLAPSR